MKNNLTLSPRGPRSPDTPGGPWNINKESFYYMERQFIYDFTYYVELQSRRTDENIIN